MEWIEVNWHVFPKLPLWKSCMCNFFWQVHIQVFSRKYEVLILLSWEKHETHKKTVTSHTTDYEYFMHLTFIFGICNRKKINMEQLLGLPQLCVNVYCSVRANCFASGCKYLFVASQQKAKHPCMNIVV